MARGRRVTIALIVITDGRADFLAETLAAAYEYLPPFDTRFIIDDSGNNDYANWLRANYSLIAGPHLGYEVVHHNTRRGLAGAVQSGFDTALRTDCDYAFWLEDDMVFHRTPPVIDACAALDKNFELANMGFKRAVTDPSEGADVLATMVERSTVHHVGPKFTTHDYIFSLNPGLIPRRTLELGWDAGNEAGQTAALLGQGFRFGMWGAPFGPDYIETIGTGRRHPQWAP